MAFGVPYQPGFAPGYYPMGQPTAMPDQLAQLRQAAYPQPAQQTSPIIWVSGYQAAESYMVAPNNAVVLWDSAAPVLYLKQADASGKPSIKIFDLIERTQQPAQAPEKANNNFVTREEFEALAAKFEALTAEKTRKKKEVEHEPTV